MRIEEIIINFRSSWLSIKFSLSIVWRVWRFWCKRLNHEAQQQCIPFFGWQEKSTSSLLRMLQACICIFRCHFVFLTELINFHIHSISVTFPNLKSNQNDIRKFHDFPDFPELSNPWYFVGFALIFVKLKYEQPVQAGMQAQSVSCSLLIWQVY